jgi:fatty-acyl-CoA synthase
LCLSPFRRDEVTVLPAPLFHGLGYVHSLLALTTGSTLVLRRRFDASRILADVESHKATATIVVPVMLTRILDALDAAVVKPDLSSLRIVFVSGSQLGAELATRALRELGPVVYNMYGSTEISYISIAGPCDLSANPSTAGRVVTGVRVRILDEYNREVRQGVVGRIFAGTFFPFEGYTGGGGKVVVDGLMSSGDVGYFDENGLLYVSGRDDEMIVSGGENVFPAEVEDLISGHREVVEAAVMGVEDEEWGQRLRAFVVRADHSTIDEATVKAYVRERLARYKVPRDVVFVDELPRNPAGKIVKRQLGEAHPG